MASVIKSALELQHVTVLLRVDVLIRKEDCDVLEFELHDCKSDGSAAREPGLSFDSHHISSFINPNSPNGGELQAKQAQQE